MLVHCVTHIHLLKKNILEKKIKPKFHIPVFFNRNKKNTSCPNWRIYLHHGKTKFQTPRADILGKKNHIFFFSKRSQCGHRIFIVKQTDAEASNQTQYHQPRSSTHTHSLSFSHTLQNQHSPATSPIRFRRPLRRIDPWQHTE